MIEKLSLKNFRGLLDEISEFLLVKETITGDELMAYIQADQKKLEQGKEETAPSDAQTTEE